MPPRSRATTGTPAIDEGSPPQPEEDEESPGPERRARQRRWDAADPSLIVFEDRRRAKRARSSEGPAKTADDVERELQEVRAKGRELYARMTAPDQAGEELHLPFVDLPDPTLYPDYYEVIKKPMSYSIVRDRIENKEFKTLEQLKDVFGSVFNNAKRYNAPGSEIHTDAKKLHKLLKQTYAMLNGDAPDDGYVYAQDEEDERPLPSTSRGGGAGHRSESVVSSKAGGSHAPPYNQSQNDRHQKRGPTLQPWLVRKLKEFTSHADASGRVYTARFWDLPTKAELPEYYQYITHPMSLKVIQAKVKNGEYATVKDFSEDVKVMLENALFFNEESSRLWKDAKLLERTFTDLMKEVPPSFVPPRKYNTAKRRAEALKSGNTASGSDIGTPFSDRDAMQGVYGEQGEFLSVPGGIADEEAYEYEGDASYMPMDVEMDVDTTGDLLPPPQNDVLHIPTPKVESSDVFDLPAADPIDGEMLPEASGSILGDISIPPFTTAPAVMSPFSPVVLSAPLGAPPPAPPVASGLGFSPSPAPAPAPLMSASSSFQGIGSPALQPFTTTSLAPPSHAPSASISPAAITAAGLASYFGVPLGGSGMSPSVSMSGSVGNVREQSVPNGTGAQAATGAQEASQQLQQQVLSPSLPPSATGSSPPPANSRAVAKMSTKQDAPAVSHVLIRMLPATDQLTLENTTVRQHSFTLPGHTESIELDVFLRQPTSSKDVKRSSTRTNKKAADPADAPAPEAPTTSFTLSVSMRPAGAPVTELPAPAPAEGSEEEEPAPRRFALKPKKGLNILEVLVHQHERTSALTSEPVPGQPPEVYRYFITKA